jgi:hypothetical protein
MIKALFLAAILGVSSALQLRDVAEDPKVLKPPPKPKPKSTTCTATYTCAYNDNCGPTVSQCTSVQTIVANCVGTSFTTFNTNDGEDDYPFSCNTPSGTPFTLNVPCNGGNFFVFGNTQWSGSGSATYVVTWTPVTAGTCAPPSYD